MSTSTGKKSPHCGNCDYVKNILPYNLPPHFTTGDACKQVIKENLDIPQQTVLSTISRMKSSGEIKTVLRGARNINGKSGGSERDILKLRTTPKEDYYVWNGQRDPYLDQKTKRISNSTSDISIPWLIYQYAISRISPFLRRGTVNNIEYYLKEQNLKRNSHTIGRIFKLCAGEGEEADKYNGVVFLRKATQQEEDQSLNDLLGITQITNNIIVPRQEDIIEPPKIHIQMPLFPEDFNSDQGLTELIQIISDLLNQGLMPLVHFENFHALIKDNDEKCDRIETLQQKIKDLTKDKEELKENLRITELEAASLKVNKKGRIKISKPKETVLYE